MQLFDLYKHHFGHKTFDSVEDYNAEVLRYTSALSEELGNIYKYVVNSPSDVIDELNVTILYGEN